MINKIPHPALLLSATLLVSACASPSASQPQAVLFDAAAYGLAAQASVPASAQGSWWLTLADPALTQLIADALAQHPALTEAQARVRAAGADVAASQAAGGPQLDLNASRERSRTSEYGILPPPIAGNWHTVNALSLDLGWRLDLWGQIRAQTDSARASEAAARLQKEDTRQWLASAIAAQYLELQQARQQETLLTQELALAARQSAYSQALYRSGISSADGPDAARAEQKTIAERLAQARAQRAQASHALAALSAQPQTRIDQLPARDLPAWQVATAALTTRALGARADLQAAIANVRAAELGVQAATAAFYPDVTLGAFAGVQAQSTGDLFSRGALAAGVLPGVTLPIFHAGALNAQLDAQSARYDAAVAAYNRTLLAALQQAADGVSDTRRAQEGYAEARQTFDALTRIAKRSATRARQGLIAPTQAVAAQRQALQSQQNLIAAHGRVLLAQTQLMRALAGTPTY